MILRGTVLCVGSGSSQNAFYFFSHLGVNTDFPILLYGFMTGTLTQTFYIDKTDSWIT